MIIPNLRLIRHAIPELVLMPELRRELRRKSVTGDAQFKLKGEKNQAPKRRYHKGGHNKDRLHK